MRAVVMHGYGGPEVLELAELPTPEPGPGEVLVRVRAVAVNPADGKWRSGMFAGFAPVPFPHVLGYDVAGEVVSGGGVAAGTRVAAMLDPFLKGGYADHAAVATDRLTAIPPAMGDEVAAALPTAGLTGLQMAEAVAAGPGVTVLVTGATGAVGRFAMLAARAEGARVVAAVRGGRVDEALALGADAAVDIAAPWRGGPFDHVLDTVGGAEVAALCRHLRPGGTILTAATTPIEGDGMPATPTAFAVTPSGADLTRLIDLVMAVDYPVPIAAVLPLAEAGRAQRMVERGGLAGKVILRP